MIDYPTGITAPSLIGRSVMPSRDEVLAADGEVVYLLQLEIGGVTHRVASVPFETSDGIVYTSGLLTWDAGRSLDLFSGSLNVPEARVVCDLPDVSIAAMWAQGHRMTEGAAELSLSVSGRSNDARVVLVRGQISEPKWGIQGDPIEFVIARSPRRQERLWPDGDAAISERTWDTSSALYPTDNIGFVYPTIINRPGWDQDTVTAFRGSNAKVCMHANGAIGTQPDLVLIAGHAVGPNWDRVNNRVGGVITGATGTGRNVVLADITAVATATREVFNIRDDLGHVVAVVKTDNWGGGGALDPLTGDHEYQIRWNTTASGTSTDYAVGMRGLRGEVMTSAADIVEWALLQSGYDVDQGLVRSYGSLLPLRLSGLIEERVDLLEWLQDNVWDLIPVSVEDSGRGVYPYVLDPSALRRADMQLIEGETCWRVSVGEEHEPLNELTMSWLLAVSTGRHMHSRTYSGASLIIPQAKRSLSWQSPVRDSIQSDLITLSADAAWVAGWRLRLFGAPWIEGEYELEPEMIGIELGALYPLTDTGLSLSRWALVIGVQYLAEGPRVKLMIPQRDGL